MLQAPTSSDYKAIYSLFGYDTTGSSTADVLTHTGSDLEFGSDLAVSLFSDHQQVANIMAVGVKCLAPSGGWQYICRSCDVVRVLEGCTLGVVYRYSSFEIKLQ